MDMLLTYGSMLINYGPILVIYGPMLLTYEWVLRVSTMRPLLGGLIVKHFFIAMKSIKVNRLFMLKGAIVQVKFQRNY